jgi:hypothetical protein
MRHFFRSIFFVIAFFTCAGMNGQDKIITVRNDTLECKIVSISPTHINYEQTVNGYTAGKYIPVRDVLEYYMGAASQSAQYAGKTDSVRYVRPESQLFEPWQAEVRFGGSYLTASNAVGKNNLIVAGMPEAEITKFYKRSRHGIHLGVSIRRLFSVSGGNVGIGTGLKYRLSSFSSHLDVMIPQYSSAYRFIEDENIYVNFWGVSCYLQQWLGQKRRFRLAYEIAPGYVRMRDEVRFGEGRMIMLNNLLSKGGAPGVDAEITFSYRHSKWLSVNLVAGYLYAVFKRFTARNKYDETTVELDRSNYVSVSHLNYSAGIQFNF